MSDNFEDDFRTFVGKKPDYYLTPWHSYVDKGSRGAGFNRDGFVFSGLWYQRYQKGKTSHS